MQNEILMRLKNIDIHSRGMLDYMSVVNEFETKKELNDELVPVKIAILRNFTIDTFLPAIKAELYLNGFKPVIYCSDYDVIAQEVLDPNSQFYKFEPDIIFVFTWLDTLSDKISNKFLQHYDCIEDEIDHVVNQIEFYVTSIRKNSKSPIVVNNYPIIGKSTFGILDAQLERGKKNTILNINNALQLLNRKFADFYIFDLNAIFCEVGSLNAFDYKYWNIAKSPFSKNILGFVANYISRFVCALKGKAKKCLILDCDNTLWGGIIGEDGLNGIKIGDQGGEGFHALQNEILNLHDRGIILALCSKNNEQDVMEVLSSHPNMLIRKSHLANYKINWVDKVTNIKSIATELNIGLDSVVFVDDNIFEIGHVNESLPEVSTIHLPPDQSQYKDILLRDGFFDSLLYTKEDKNKNKMYGEAKVRSELQSSSSTIEDYLKNLEISVDIFTPSEIDIPRISQLTQKTNQFNLTTKRYTEGNISEFLKSSMYDVFAMSVEDKVSALGIVGAAIVHYDREIATIDTFLMSCRALGRGVELALLSHIANKCRELGIKQVVGLFKPTPKNSQVEKFYTSNGFLVQNPISDEFIESIADLNSVVFKNPDYINIKKVN